MMLDKDFAPVMERIFSSKNLSLEDFERFMRSIINEQMSESRAAAVLTSLRFLPPTAEVAMICAQLIMQHNASMIDPGEQPCVECSSLAYDSQFQVCIPTLAGIVAAATGLQVAQFGVRSLSGQSSAANTLETIGIPLAHNAEHVKRDLSEIGISFLYAPHFYPSMKHLGIVRRSLGFHTLFDLVFPLVNPVSLSGQILGVHNKDLMKIAATCLKQAGRKRALLVYSEDFGDAISPYGKTYCLELNGESIREFQIKPDDFGIHVKNREDFEQNRDEDSAALFIEILESETPSLTPLRELVALNAAGLLWSGDLAPDLVTGMRLARKAISSGKASTKLRKWEKVKRSNDWQRHTCY